MDWQTINFDWNRARAFWVVAKEGSLSGAARAIATTQPTIGRQISALEQQLKVTLFDRVGNQLRLTDSGAALLEQVEQMGQAATQFSLVAHGQEQAIEGEVTIAVTELDGRFLLPKIVQAVRAKAPGIRLCVRVSNEVSDLKQRDADMAIRYQRPSQPDLIIRQLHQERVWLYGTHELCAKHANSLSQVPIIGFEDYRRQIAFLNQIGWQLSESDVVVTCDSQTSQIEMLRQGIGFAFLPEPIAGRFPELTPVANQQPIDLTAWLVCQRELHTSRRMRLVFDTIVEQLTGE
ncbi:LysR family transcriptional regulator [Salinibius halmophilus]|uniref:LysR family transcriptional regulator n=1 Tax=Salinibius halmophilus TaxID=1853216 RepID=UPI000E66F858|nr:LysR family transcriptional regulator [Salinibius halmophilus]